jgi:hypothetical protein
MIHLLCLLYSLDPLRGASSWHMACSRHRLQAICHLLTTCTWDQVLVPREASLSTIMGQQLKCQRWEPGGLIFTICYHVPCTRRSYNKFRGIILFVTFRNSFVCVHKLFNTMDFSYVSISLTIIAHCRAFSLFQFVLLLGREDQRRRQTTNTTGTAVGLRCSSLYIKHGDWSTSQRDKLKMTLTLLFLSINNFYW